MSSLKIVSWNINSIRARMEIVEKFLVEESPDVLCLQETKVRDADFPEGMFRRLSLLAIAPVAIALVIAGCGSSNSSSTTAATTTKPPSSSTSTSSTSGQGQVLKISADPSGQLRFNTSMLTISYQNSLGL